MYNAVRVRPAIAVLLVLGTVAPAWAQQKMYLVAGSTIRRADFDGSNLETLINSGLSGPDGIALDVAGGKMYWVEQGSGRVRRANLDGSDVDNLVTAGGQPHNLALDVAGGKMYWSEVVGGRIRRANLDGTSVELVFNAANVDGLVIDFAGGKVYFTQGSQLRRANLDGTSNELLYSQGGATPHGLALDVANGHIYWTDFGLDRIRRGDLDGSGPAVDLVTTGLSLPIDVKLDFDQGRMYWTDLGLGVVRSANLDGSDVQTPLTSQPSPFGIALDLTVEEVPTLSEWGLMGLALALVVAGAQIVSRRTAVAA